MNSYSEVRRVRTAMSEAAGHDIRRLIAKINERRPQSTGRIIDPGTKAEQSDARQATGGAFSNGESSAAAE